MRVGRILICALLVLADFQFLAPNAAAVGSQNVVISQLQTGGSGSGTAGQEFIEIYNNSSADVDVSNWCLTYSSSSDAQQLTVACMTAPNATTHVWLKAKSYATFVSPDYRDTHGGLTGDGVFTYTNGMAGTAGHVRLVNAQKNELDKVAWGTTSVQPPEITAPAPAGGKALLRVGSGGVLQDTDSNTSDFSVIDVPILHNLTNGVYTSALYEVVVVVDVCPNIPDTQPTMPPNYLADENGNCQPDSCLNLPGLQVNVPDNYDADGSGNCTPHDECDNVAGIQTDIPDNMVRDGVNDCAWDIPPVMLTEILPNAFGTDTGNEFVEVYNPTNQTVDLSLYSVKTGINSDKTYAFPIGATIAPGEYRAFSDSLMKFTLVNTTSRVVLGAVDGSTLGDTGTYDSPADGESWALIDGAWQYTNQPTPGAANRPSIIEEVAIDSTDTGLAPCPAGKYRNPLTNRCRNIETDASVLAACEADQYRSPDTGRCRKITTAGLTPCKDGQYRSEETNRCRNIVAASTSKPCKDNQYRSEETNRCRNLPAAGVPDAAFAVQPVKDTGMVFVGWWALGGVGLLAAGYAAWEWRRELIAFWNRTLKR